MMEVIQMGKGVEDKLQVVGEVLQMGRVAEDKWYIGGGDGDCYVKVLYNIMHLS